jgi:hypothetical protein
MADVLAAKRQEIDPDEELQALQEEFSGIHQAGHQRRRAWIVEQFQENAAALALGQVTDDRLRHQAEGRCQAFKAMLDRDDEVREAWHQHLADEEAKRQPEALEGHDYGVSYEAAQ